MKHAFRLSRACAALFALAALLAAAPAAPAQTLSPTPDTAAFQITSTAVAPQLTPTPTPSATPTPTPTPAPIPRNSFANDISGSGRFVVIESAGDIATDRSPARNNADGNQEIFLFDYAQRRIFQITNTKSVLKDAAKPSYDPTNIEYDVVNLQPSISRDGRFIAFYSNAYSDANPAASPRSFDGPANVAALEADGNSEIFIYALPAFAEVADLSQGTEVAAVDLAAGTMTRVTFTPASAAMRKGANGFSLDNYEPMLSDDGALVAFISQAGSGIPGSDNSGDQKNKEVFIYRRAGAGAGTFVQVTKSADLPPTSSNPLGVLVFNESPSISGCVAPSACRVAFVSNANNISTESGQGEPAASQNNGEVFVADYNNTTGSVSAVRQVTKTASDPTPGRTGFPINVLSPGRRISRDGALVAFESRATFNPDGTLGTLADTLGIYIANVSGASPSFAQVSVRAPADTSDLDLRFPTFTGDNSRLVWVSNLNLKPDGTVATAAGEGLNEQRRALVFSAPVATPNAVSRVANVLTGSFTAVQAFPSDTVRRMALSLPVGSGFSFVEEAFYQLIPVATSETPAPSPTPATSPAPVSFFTGASNRPVVSPSPAPSPSEVTGLAPGMLGIARSTLTLAPTTREVDRNNAHETQRRPSLPVELANVTVTVSGAAAGLYFVSPNQINFVVPTNLALTTTPASVVIFNNGSLIRTSVLLNPVQPDVYTSTNGPGGRAAVVNVTNPCVAPTGEPFTVTTTRPAGSGSTGVCTGTTTETAPTRLLIMLTGLRPIAGTVTTVSVRIGTTDLTGASIISFGPSNTPGFDQVIVELPASLAGAGDVPVIVSATAGGQTFTSRAADTAPRITIQ